MIIAFASGKGGTGKTMMATSFAASSAEDGSTTYVDADVEEPNGHLFLVHSNPREEPVEVFIPELVGTCTGCGACQRACAFNAILPLKRKVVVFSGLCHSCGACVMACPEAALDEVPHRIGTLTRAHSGGVSLITGRLDVGEPRATPLVEAAVAAGVRHQERAAGGGPSATGSGPHAAEADHLVVIDSPPGTSCAAMAAVRRADLVVLVTEPTPFGLNDLTLAVEMCRALGRQVAVVLNRSDLGNDAVLEYVAREGIPLLGRIPFSEAVARTCAEGGLASGASLEIRQAIESVRRHLEHMREETRE